MSTENESIEQAQREAKDKAMRLIINHADVIHDLLSPGTSIDITLPDNLGGLVVPGRNKEQRRLIIIRPLTSVVIKTR